LLFALVFFVACHRCEATLLAPTTLFARMTFSCDFLLPTFTAGFPNAARRFILFNTKMIVDSRWPVCGRCQRRFAFRLPLDYNYMLMLRLGYASVMIQVMCASASSKEETGRAIQQFGKPVRQDPRRAAMSFDTAQVGWTDSRAPGGGLHAQASSEPRGDARFLRPCHALWPTSSLMIFKARRRPFRTALTASSPISLFPVGFFKSPSATEATNS